jgi:hypothetical protein
MKKKVIKERSLVRGFYRVQLTAPGDDQKIVGDSGWCENTIVNNGYTDFLVKTLAGVAGSKQALGISIGTGTAPNATHATLDGEISTAKRKTPTASLQGTKTAQFLATFYSSDSFLAGASNIRNIGLMDCTTATGTLFAGSTYGSSSCDTNQNVNVTYQIIFS